MKSLSANLKHHLEGTNLTVCTLWKITREDTQVFGFTDNSRDVVYSGTTYKASTGMTPSAIKTSASFNVDNLEVQSVLDDTSITEADIDAGLWDYAVVEVMLVNYNTLADGHMMRRKGWIGEVKTSRSFFVAELRGLMQTLQQSLGRYYLASCDARLGDTRCTISLGGFTTTGTATLAPASPRMFTDVALVAPATGYYNGGVITWTGGDNLGYKSEIKSSTNLALTATGITNITKAVTPTVTVANTFAAGDTVSFSGVLGMTQINGLSAIILTAVAGSFTIDLNTSAFSTHSGSAGVATRAGTRFVLQQNMVNTIDAGDGYSVVAGCDKTLATCKTKFNNVVNFRGYPYIPGVDKLVSGK